MARLNLVCVDNSEFSHNGFEWYVSHHHKDDDVIGLVHVHEPPHLPAIGMMGGGAGLVEIYQSQLEASYQMSKGEWCS